MDHHFVEPMQWACWVNHSVDYVLERRMLYHFVLQSRWYVIYCYLCLWLFVENDGKRVNTRWFWKHTGGDEVFLWVVHWHQIHSNSLICENPRRCLFPSSPFSLPAFLRNEPRLGEEARKKKNLGYIELWVNKTVVPFSLPTSPGTRNLILSCFRIVRPNLWAELQPGSESDIFLSCVPV